MHGPVVVLDIDGTLVDSNDAHARAWVDAFAEAGIQVSPEKVRRSIGMGGDKLMPHVSGIAEDSSVGAPISRRRGEIFKTVYLPTIRPFPGVRPLIERFAADGFTIVVASSAKKEELEPLLQIAGVADLVHARTSSDDAEESKPDPDIVTAALKSVKAAPGTSVMIGDTPYDVEAARRAGIAIVGVECGGWRRDDLQGAVEVYADPAALHARYADSVFGTLVRSAARPSAAGPPGATLVWLAASLVLAGAVLVALGARRRAPAFPSIPPAASAADDLPPDGYAEVAHRESPGPGPEEREALRKLLAP